MFVIVCRYHIFCYDYLFKRIINFPERPDLLYFFFLIRKRISGLPNTTAGFSVYLKFKDRAVPYLNSNFYSFNSGSPWGLRELSPKPRGRKGLSVHALLLGRKTEVRI